jgi:hypothetical protein
MECSGPVQACNGITLHFTFTVPNSYLGCLNFDCLPKRVTTCNHYFIISVNLSDSCEKEFRNIGMKSDIETNKIHSVFFLFWFLCSNNAIRGTVQRYNILKWNVLLISNLRNRAINWFPTACKLKFRRMIHLGNDNNNKNPCDFTHIQCVLYVSTKLVTFEQYS